ncbi:outer membrane protein assembly factor [Glaciecola sp. MH2013]|uniref:autotransporter assembly complex protein TamA n=1 Tax=Glaciecola sp. MH2013 TaxID=2785524 RepID=UPI00189D64B7|nr:autotransporter assembly complex family protein [Glaciecola sp. MH2013]MBF7071869.1 outer membrane protein assembly factor [Glaciecola sp. MH2013]
MRQNTRWVLKQLLSRVSNLQIRNDLHWSESILSVILYCSDKVKEFDILALVINRLFVRIFVVICCCLLPLHVYGEWLIKGVDADIESNIRLHLSELTLPTNDFELAQFDTKVKSKVNTAVRAFSYYEATIELLELDSLLLGNSEQKATVQISLGRQLVVDNVTLNMDEASLKALSLAHFPLQIKSLLDELRAMRGKVFNHGDYERIKSSVRSFALIFGYFDFELSEHKVAVRSKTSQASIIWTLQFGQRYRFGELQFIGDKKGIELVNSVRPFSTGDFFNQQLLGNFTQAMRQTGYYESALARANIDAASDIQKSAHLVPIEVLLKTKPRDTYQFGVGASTDSGPRLTFNWERPWVNLRGHTLSSELYLSAPRKSAALAYQIPMANPLNDFLNIQLGFQQLNEDQRESDTFSLALQRQFGAVEENEWNKIAFIRYEYERFTQGIDIEQSTQLLLPGVSFNRVRKRGDLFVNWGDRQQIKIEAASQDLLSDIDLVRVTAQTKWIRSFDKHRFILRADAGAIFASDFEQVPSSLRFFAGGDNSVRGFQLNTISASRIDELTNQPELIGAKFLSVASTEYAYQVAEAWRAAFFVDAGSASDALGEDLVYGVGSGAHWLSPVGTVRLYIARGFNEEEKTWRLHFSIGPGL